MFKLFLKFYLVIAIPLVFLFVPAINPVSKVVENWAEDLYIDEFNGVFQLLERELEIIPQDDWTAHIEMLNENFGTPVILKQQQQIKLNESKLQRIQSGEIVLQLAATPKLYKQVQNSDFVVVLYMDLPSEDSTHQLLRGPVYLINRLLEDTPTESWDRTLQEFQKNSNVTVRILKVEQLSQELQQDPRLKKRKVIEKQLEENLNTLYLKTPNPDYVYAFGPVDERNFHDRIKSIQTLLPASLLAIGILLLAIPLWRDIKKLRLVANEFSSGNFNHRIQLRRSSVLSPLARSFNRLGAAVKNLLQGQKEISNAVSHEIKTPLARLRFAVEMLRDKPTQIDSNRFLDDIDRDVREIEVLIDEILLHSRYDRAVSEQSFETINVIQTVTGILDVFQDYHPEINMRRAMPNTAINADIDHTGIKHAVNNLLGNAARHANSQIKVSVLKQSSWISIVVEDDGEGVDVVDRDRIFKPFLRLDQSRQRDTGGSGLGLSIVERIAEWHGGKVECKESSLGGAKFIFQFPNKQ